MCMSLMGRMGERLPEPGIFRKLGIKMKECVTSATVAPGRSRVRAPAIYLHVREN